MAAGFVPKPGSKHGPCKDHCYHVDCAALRSVSEAPCWHCQKEIGYETRFYHLSNYGAYAHASCEEKAAEEGR